MMEEVAYMVEAGKIQRYSDNAWDGLCVVDTCMCRKVVELGRRGLLIVGLEWIEHLPHIPP